jgi:hypothetical protein
MCCYTPKKHFRVIVLRMMHKGGIFFGTHKMAGQAMQVCRVFSMLAQARKVHDIDAKTAQAGGIC